MMITELMIPAATLAVIVGALLKIILLMNDRSMNFRFKKLEEAAKSANENWDRRHGKNESLVLELEKAILVWSERLIKVEANVEHMPSHFEIQKINNDLGHLQGETNTQTALLQRMEQQMRRINDWMMENK